jgi:hypothetical protein
VRRHTEDTFAQHTLAQTYRHVVDSDIVLQSTQTCIALISDNTFFTVKGNFVFRCVNVRIPRCFFAQEVNFLPGMAASVAQAAKRDFVAVLLALARQYGVDVGVNRDSQDELLEKTFKKVVCRGPEAQGL